MFTAVTVVHAYMPCGLSFPPLCLAGAEQVLDRKMSTHLCKKKVMTEAHSADVKLLSQLKQIIPTLYANTMHSYRYNFELFFMS